MRLNFSFSVNNSIFHFVFLPFSNYDSILEVISRFFFPFLYFYIDYLDLDNSLYPISTFLNTNYIVTNILDLCLSRHISNDFIRTPNSFIVAHTVQAMHNKMQKIIEKNKEHPKTYLLFCVYLFSSTVLSNDYIFSNYRRYPSVGNVIEYLVISLIKEK